MSKDTKDIKADIFKIIFRIHALKPKLPIGTIIYNAIDITSYSEDIYPLCEYSDDYLLELLEKYYESIKEDKN
jgi:hypothetical protein